MEDCKDFGSAQVGESSSIKEDNSVQRLVATLAGLCEELGSTQTIVSRVPFSSRVSKFPNPVSIISANFSGAVRWPTVSKELLERISSGVKTR